MGPQQLSSKLIRGNTEVLAIHCGDYRFQGAFHEFLNEALGLGKNYDLMVIPGGPLSLALLGYRPQYSWSAWKWFRFFIEMHGVKRLILIQHQDCAWYRTMPAHLHDSPELRARQEQDLGRIVNMLEKEFPKLAVELYYAEWDDAGHVTMEPVKAKSAKARAWRGAGAGEAESARKTQSKRKAANK